MSSVAVTRDGYVAVVEVHPPGGLHDRSFSEALVRAAEDIASTDARVVILRGAFGVGWAPDGIEEPLLLAGLPLIAAGIHAIAALPQPVIAAVDGDAHSAGMELALACDVRVAAPSATFAMPDTAAGTVPMAGGTQRLPRAIGRAAATRLLLLGETIDAREALRIGLISQVVDRDSALDAARVIADAVAARGPLATRLAKEAVHRGTEMTLEQALRYELDLTVILQSTEDRTEGVRAFMERRPPEFTGR